MKPLTIAQLITKRNTASFDRYLNDISKLSRKGSLSAEEEVTLAERIKNGDENARKELIQRNLKFVISVAKQYQCAGVSLEDLVNEGNLGLIKAATKFDSAKGFKFISYAVWWIRQSIISYLSENAKIIRLPLNKIGQLTKINKFKENFEQKNQRLPTIEEIEIDLGLSNIDRLLFAERGVQSINAEFSDKSKGTYTFEEMVFDANCKKTDECVDNEDLKDIIKRMMSKLSYRHKIVMEMYYGLNGGEPKTFEEIAYTLDLTRERIRQIHIKCLTSLKRNPNNCKLAQPYLK